MSGSKTRAEPRNLADFQAFPLSPRLRLAKLEFILETNEGIARYERYERTPKQSRLRNEPQKVLKIKIHVLFDPQPGYPCVRGADRRRKPSNRAVIAASDIHELPDLTPKHDERFSALLDGALSGDVPVYFAAVPLALCVPFDLDYRPEMHPVGAMAIRQMTEEGRNGQFQNMFFCQRGKRFVVSDDYIVLFATLNGLPDYMPCSGQA